MLDWFAPRDRDVDIPEIEVSGAKRALQEIRGGRYELLGAWPESRADLEQTALADGGITTVRESESLRLIHGTKRPVVVSILCSTTELTAGTFSVAPGSRTEPEQHPGDEVVYALSGQLHVHLPDTGAWFELDPLDVAYIPSGTPHEYWSYGTDRAKAVFCVAPSYR